MNRLSKAAAQTLVENGFVKPEDFGVCEYGIDIFLISVSEICFILMVSLIMRNSIETLLWMLSFFPIRIYAGGYHADTRMRCFGVFVAVYAVFSLMLVYVPVYQKAYLLISIACAAAIVKWSPIQHTNKTISVLEKKIFRKRSLICTCIEGTIAVVILLTGIEHTYAKAVLYGLFTAGISLLAGKIKNSCKERSEEKRKE